MPGAEEIVLNADEQITDTVWKKLSGQYNNGTMVLWLGIDDLSQISRLVGDPPLTTFVTSATMLGKDLYALPEHMRQHTLITYPFRLP